MSYAAQLSEHYAQVRSRLTLAPRILQLTATKPEVVELVESVEPEGRAPLNMLGPCSWRFLLRLASVRHNIPESVILSKSRQGATVVARHDAMSMVYQHTQMSLPQVGNCFCRDHTTVFHALEKMGRKFKLVDQRMTIEPTPRTPKPKAASPQKPAKHPRNMTALQKAVARAYVHNVPPSMVAEEYGCNPKSVKVIAHNLGLKRSDFNGKHKTDWSARGRIVVAAQ